MANDVEIEVTGNENVSDMFDDVASAASDAGDSIVGSMGDASGAMSDTGNHSERLGGALGNLGDTASGLSDAIGDAGGTLQAFTDFQNQGKEKAAALARANDAVEQAMSDEKQAALDLKQAQLDLNQAQQDGKQAAADLQQAHIDADQANLDAAEAQKAYNEAVKENGPNSAEAKQAAIDLKQAQADLNQANLDASQAEADAAQATQDGTQAQNDANQATIDGKEAALDLADAQKEAKQPTGLAAWAAQANLLTPLIMGVVGAIDLMTMANNALSLSFIKSAATQAATKVATIATSVATGIATAAQWLWNVAMSANPLGIIILLIGALIGVIILIATKTTWFQDLWHAIWGAIGDPIKIFIGWIVDAWNATIHALGAAVTWVKDAIIAAFRFAIDFVIGYFKFIFSIPGRIIDVFAAIGNGIAAPFKWAFNQISKFWNSTVGRLSFTMPSWIPGIGGMGFHMPTLPTLAKGGDIISSGLAFVHANERVLTAAETRDVKEGKGLGGNGRIIGFIGAGVGAALAEVLNMLIRTGDLQWQAGDEAVSVA